MSSKHGKIVTLHSSKGGVGKTVLARNIATLLASQNKSVCIYEANVSGNMGMMMGLFPTITTDNISDKIGSGDAQQKLLLAKDEYHVSLLSYGHLLVLQNQEKSTNLILDQLTSDYDVVIVDTDSKISVSSIVSLKRSNHILFVHDNNHTAYNRFLERYEVLIGNESSGEGLGISRDVISFVYNKNKTLRFDREIKDRGVMCYRVEYNKEFEELSDKKEEAPFVISNPKSATTKEIKEIICGIFPEIQFNERRGWGGLLS